MNLHEINQDGCSITCFKREMGWGIDYGMNVDFPTWMTYDWIQEHREMIQKVTRYTANKIEMLLLTDAVAFFKKLKEYGMEVDQKDGVLIFYEGDKSAFIRPFIFQNKLSIDPFITFSSTNEFGFTLIPGSFSDFIISSRMVHGGLFGYTKDFHTSHFGIATLYLLNVMENFETIINKKQIPSDFDDYSIYQYAKMNPAGKEVTHAIQHEIKALCSVNQNKRIDTLIVNKKTIYDYIREYDLTYYLSVRDVSLLQIAIALGKTTTQVEKFVKKFIDKQRAS